jgi:hypothetical protein
MDSRSDSDWNLVPAGRGNFASPLGLNLANDICQVEMSINSWSPSIANAPGQPREISPLISTHIWSKSLGDISTLIAHYS